VPAPSVRSHLTSLIGATIPTITGRPNRIVGIEGDNVIVATQRSPEGEPVALTSVQAAADRVFDGEIVRIDRAVAGFRSSAFVGAVLQSMPDVEVLRNPPRAMLATRPAGLNDVEVFLRAAGGPLEDPMSGRRFDVVATNPGTVTYRRFNGTRVGTVSTETLQAILDEVLERARAAEEAWPENAGDAMFTVGLEYRFWTDHGYFANAVIAGMAHQVLDWFDGLMPDENGILGSDTPAELTARQGAASSATVGLHSDSTRVGVPYVAADESVFVTERDPFETDPDVVERGTRSHARLQNQLAVEVVSAGQVPLSPSPDDPLFDLAWRDGADLHVAEVKSTTPTNEEHQLRLGLGQLLRYRYALSADGTNVHATLYVERQPADPQWGELCESLGITLRWPTP
jgi:hypothetical protein